MFNPHGYYKINRDDNFIQIVAGDSWNKECAEQFLLDLQQLVGLGVSDSNLVVLTILEENWVPTADSINTLAITTQWGIEKGMHKEAFVTNSFLSEQILTKITSSYKNSPCTFKCFESEKDARFWLLA